MKHRLTLALPLLLACTCTASVEPDRDAGPADAGVGDAGQPQIRDPLCPPIDCIEGWPSVWSDPGAVASLPVTSPAVRWRLDLRYGGLSGGPALAAGVLGVSTGNRVFLVSTAGALVSEKMGQSGEELSPPVADAEGNFYFVGSGLYSISKDGTSRWVRAYGANKLPYNHTIGRRPLLTPDGVVLSAPSDKQLYAIRASDGEVLWTKELPDLGQQLASFGAGIGSTFSLQVQNRGVLFSATTGERVGCVEPATEEGRTSIDFFAPPAGIVTSSWSGATVSSAIFSECGQTGWTGPAGAYVSLVGPSGSLLVQHFDDAGNAALSVYSARGDLLHHQRPLGEREGIRAVGADGVLYSFRCSGDDWQRGPASVVARRLQDLSIQWTLDLGGGCPEGNVVLDDDGTLYLARHTPSLATELVAIQTTSPGPARSSWPLLRHDNRQTGWVIAP